MFLLFEEARSLHDGTIKRKKRGGVGREELTEQGTLNSEPGKCLEPLTTETADCTLVNG